MIKTLGTVLEAAAIRATQWRDIANGVSPLDIVDEMHETQPEEAASIAEEQEAAISHVRGCLPAGGTQYDPDILAINAMCLWEEALDYSRARLDEDEDGLYSWLAKGEGAFAAREGCWELAGMAEYGWRCITNDGKNDAPSGLDAFDWDFIPVWLPAVHAVAVAEGLKPCEITEDHARKAVNAVLDNL